MSKKFLAYYFVIFCNIAFPGQKKTFVGYDGLVLPKKTTTQRDALTGKITGQALYDSTTNKISLYNGTSWSNLLSDSLVSAHIFVGNGSTLATDVAVSGDLTLANTGAFTIANTVVTNAKLNTMGAHTFKGNNTGSTDAPLDLTATQLTAELNNFVGDSGSGGTKGLVPAPSSGDAAAGKYLKADGTFAIPPGSTTAATSNYFSGLIAAARYWTTTSNTYVDGTIDSGSNTLTTLTSAGLTVTAGASNIMGITWTPSSNTAVYLVTASSTFDNSSSGVNNYAKLTDGSVTLDEAATQIPGAGAFVPFKLSGIFAPASSSPVTIKIQIRTSAGTIKINDPSLGIYWTVIEIK